MVIRFSLLASSMSFCCWFSLISLPRLALFAFEYGVSGVDNDRPRVVEGLFTVAVVVAVDVVNDNCLTGIVVDVVLGVVVDDAEINEVDNDVRCGEYGRAIGCCRGAGYSESGDGAVVDVVTYCVATDKFVLIDGIPTRGVTVVNGAIVVVVVEVVVVLLIESCCLSCFDDFFGDVGVYVVNIGRLAAVKNE